MKRFNVLFSLMVVFSFILLSSAPAQTPKVEKVRIGVIEPFSGPDAKYGELVKPAFQYAVDQVNKTGGIKSMGGAKLELVWGDHQSKQEVNQIGKHRAHRQGAAWEVDLLHQVSIANDAVDAGHDTGTEKVPW